MLPDSHVSSISNSGVSLSHREKPLNSLSAEDEDSAPAMGGFSSSFRVYILDCFDPPPELLFF
ncbi:unnamed protein product [Brassica rapa]|uniref:Uncharacterized protein n=1 Tax=Brassica campestris TaxID=3711 RepID=A0A3P5Y1R3_BRACM|nr:unnamed protein product [Brassica rapa]VDC61332.1 unnamed protein product [Brassica rapa]